MSPRPGPHAPGGVRAQRQRQVAAGVHQRQPQDGAVLAQQAIGDDRADHRQRVHGRDEQVEVRLGERRRRGGERGMVDVELARQVQREDRAHAVEAEALAPLVADDVRDAGRPAGRLVVGGAAWRGSARPTLWNPGGFRLFAMGRRATCPSDLPVIAVGRKLAGARHVRRHGRHACPQRIAVAGGGGRDVGSVEGEGARARRGGVVGAAARRNARAADAAARRAHAADAAPDRLAVRPPRRRGDRRRGLRRRPARAHVGRGNVFIVAPPTWRRDGHAVAWIERSAGEARLVVVPRSRERFQPLPWTLPAVSSDDRVFWASARQIVVGPALLAPRARASWTE